MGIAQAASWLHKWLALIVGVQILLWIVSGLFFALYPIERVRSEHRVAEVKPAALSTDTSYADIASLLPVAPTRLTFERDATGREVALAEFEGRKPILIDVADARVLSPLGANEAERIARAYIANAPQIRETKRIEAETPEYRGPLPAWRVRFADKEGLAVYVAADTGRVAARRSDLWRLYDGLWALHIMDWRDHENFNTGLMIITALASLIVTLAGIALLPFRLKFSTRRAHAR